MVSAPGNGMRAEQTNAKPSQSQNSRVLGGGISAPVEAVADTTHGLDRRPHQALPEPTHADVDHVAAGVVVQPPDVMEQRISRRCCRACA